uniref:Uncharacterized protein n=2 Tax=Helianthus annuus TaxID=4232 RepID=A0A251VDL5_HELAN
MLCSYGGSVGYGKILLVSRSDKQFVEDTEQIDMFKFRSCGEGYILRNEDEKFMELYTPTMKDLASRDVSRFTIMEYRTMCARLLFICYLKDVPFYLLFKRCSFFIIYF